MAYGPSTRGTTVGARVLPSDPIRMIMTQPVATIDAGVSLLEAAEELAADEIGALLVTGEGALGMLSERDVIAALGGGGDLSRIQAEDVLNYDLLWADPEISIREAGTLMMDGGVRHLPVGDGRYAVGIVSIRDIVHVLLAG